MTPTLTTSNRHTLEGVRPRRVLLTTPVPPLPMPLDLLNPCVYQSCINVCGCFVYVCQCITRHRLEVCKHCACACLVIFCSRSTRCEMMEPYINQKRRTREIYNNEKRPIKETYEGDFRMIVS